MVIGLTGSVGMGKTAASRALGRDRLPVYDADRAVHRLLQAGDGAVASVASAFPGVLRDGAIDRRLLGARVFGDQDALARLEAILHPMVRGIQGRFVAAIGRRRNRTRRAAAILDIPLLFETGGEGWCDGVLLVTAPPWLQRQRVLRRPGMNEDRLEAILSRQLPDREKRRRTPYVVQTGIGKRETLINLRRAVTLLREHRR